ncbi:MFS transporter [Angustibacter peucedani]
MRRFHLDLAPVRASRDFRLLLAAGTVFYVGGMVTYVALPYQLYHLTGSNFAVGAVGLVELVPLVVFGLYGGALADHVDRRRLLVGTGTAQVLLTAVLLANAAAGRPRVWVIYVVAGLLAVAQSLQRPSREALVPRTVTHAQLPAAVALTTSGMQLGAFVGPTIGGLLLAGPGPAFAYAVDVAGLVVATALFFSLRSYRPLEPGEPPSLAGVVAGVRYAVGRRDLLGTYVVDLVAMFFALPVVLYPALATDVFHRPELLGVLYTAETVGALVAGLTSGWTSHVVRHGRAIVVAAACWGLAVALAGLAPTLWVAAVLLAVAGAADSVSAMFRGTVWHQTIPDSMRGRMAGIEMLSYSLGPLGGQVRSGVVADLTTVRTSVVSGGVLCVAGVVAAGTWLRGFWAYDARTDEHAVAERERRAAAEEREEA